MKIGITGATGQLGRLVVSKIKTKVPSDNLVALVRSVEKAADLGIEAREADYEKPETLDRALKGIDILLLISALEVGKRSRQHGNVIAAAKKADVKWIIYTSMLHADSTSIDLGIEHLETEEAIKKSGIPYTVLRNGWYTENYSKSIPGAIAGGALLGSAGKGRISSASRADYAEAAVAVLTTPGHQGKVYELAGDNDWTMSDLAAEVSRHAGKEIPYKNLELGEYAEVLKSIGIPGGWAKAMAGWDVGASNDALLDGDRQLSKLIGRPTTPMPVTVAEVVRSSQIKEVAGK
ncbi:MAG TPA: SDR family oxidoreductase [Cyclobacteriaceae bacterium]|nr:SDR family oxidoreductase [Cyclobacteriaceae bacterium]